MRVRPTLGTGRQGWERLMGSRAAGLPSQRPGKQEEKVAKPPAGGVDMWVRRWAGWARERAPGTDRPSILAAAWTPCPTQCQVVRLWPEHQESAQGAGGLHSQSRGACWAHIQPVPMPAFLPGLIRSCACQDAAVMPINAGSRLRAGPARAGLGRGAAPPPWKVPVEGVALLCLWWPRASLGLPASPPGLMQSLPDASWLGAPGQA